MFFSQNVRPPFLTWTNQVLCGRLVQEQPQLLLRESARESACASAYADMRE